MLELGRFAMLLFGKGREVTAFKQDANILSFLSGTALGQALGWLERSLTVGFEPPFVYSWPFYPLPLYTPLFLNSVPYSGH